MSAPSPCPECGKPGRWGFDDDWCHEDSDAAMTCTREGWYPGMPEPADTEDAAASPGCWCHSRHGLHVPADSHDRLCSSCRSKSPSACERAHKRAAEEASR